MRNNRIWARILGVEKTIVEGVEYDDDAGCVVVSVRPTARARSRCGVCRRRSPGYDGGAGRRRWRALDAGQVTVLVEAPAPRVMCGEHGVVVAHVPWARHGAGHTRRFDETIAWLATHCSKSAVCELMQVAWRTVGSIVDRVWSDTKRKIDRFGGLARIGIDEISYKKGHKYLTVVVDHDSGRLVWAAEGHNADTLRGFFDLLGEARCAQITHVTADAAAWIAKVVAERCPDAIRCADPFHVVAWATAAVDKVRRGAWNRARAKAIPRKRFGTRGRPRAGTGNTGDPYRERATVVKKSRWALLKNPENLTEKQTVTLRLIELEDPALYRAYLLKESLRLIFQMSLEDAVVELGRWIGWARRCRIPEFVALARSIVTHRDSILAAIEHGLSNGRMESINTKIRLITRVAFGFRSPEALVALAMLGLGGHPPQLPGRNHPRMSQESPKLWGSHTPSHPW
ncbi:ISL3 family transposase [Rhodococcus chondri]|uniref:ISL3 family transposase n=1 Tax=Rhodococcus chondri TaxID=3065941 RepID=A0ABU7JMR3_9NOCA|nr:ISL3 family transposase [Rhodococcus sp. CC-R104]MEE2031325.1 ISL3 family transposase [Rhodococcus sp. CC-R104]